MITFKQILCEIGINNPNKIFNAIVDFAGDGSEQYLITYGDKSYAGMWNEDYNPDTVSIEFEKSDENYQKDINDFINIVKKHNIKYKIVDDDDSDEYSWIRIPKNTLKIEVD